MERENLKRHVLLKLLILLPRAALALVVVHHSSISAKILLFCLHVHRIPSDNDRQFSRHLTCQGICFRRYHLQMQKISSTANHFTASVSGAVILDFFGIRLKYVYTTTYLSEPNTDLNDLGNGQNEDAWRV